MSQKQQHIKTETISRKRALVSCDRCKLRRTRCIRLNSKEACENCRRHDVECESKLPRKQRVYGSVESLSLRFRALESLVKGIFPQENTQDINVLFKLGDARGISMPTGDDFKLEPVDIFHSPAPSPIQRHIPQLSQQSYPSPQATTGPYCGDDMIPAASSKFRPNSSLNPFVEVPTVSLEEKLIPTLFGCPHYFGPSSGFKLATTMRSLVGRCNALQEAKSIFRQSVSSPPEPVTTQRPVAPSDKDFHGPGSRNISAAEGIKFHKLPQKHPDGGEKPTSYNTVSLETIGDFLPPRSVADALIAAYFEHVHMFLPLFHRGVFQSRYEKTWERKDVLLREDEETGWLCCLALVFAFGAQALEKHDSERAKILQNKYLGFLHVYFRRLVTTTSLVNVQAMVLFTLYDHNAGKRSSAWVLIGTAVRMAISMGMHREGPNAEFDPIERNIRRLVWWSLYIFEKILCIILGRPSSIDDAEVTTHVPDEEGRDLPPDMMAKAYEMVKLSYDIRRRAYWSEALPGEFTPSIPLTLILLKELDHWFATLPSHLQNDTSMLPKQRRGVLVLHVYYYYIRSIVTRNYLVHKIERDICRLENKPLPPSDNLDQILNLSEDCIVSALKSLQALNAVANTGYLNGVSWLDVFFVFHAVLIVCADFLARPKDQPETTEDFRRKNSVRTILRSTRAIKLAPTYNILSQVAFQFAIITGATDELYAPYQKPGGSQILSPNPQPHTFGKHGSVTDIPNPTNEDWFENEAANGPWDFFDMDSQRNPAM